MSAKIVLFVGTRVLRGRLERLYQERYDRFLRVALGIVRDPAAAHDAVQDGFARALAALGSYDGRGSLEGWVWRIVVNAALALRRPGHDWVDELEPSFEGEGDPDELGVREWIARLPERQRLVIFLRYYADLDYRTIAQVAGTEVGTVSATLSAAHTALRRQLREVRR